MKVGILTGGGDVPGLNASIKAVVMRMASEGHQVVGHPARLGRAARDRTRTIPSGTAEHVMALDPGVVRTIDRTGGTFLHTSRTNPAKVRPTEEPAFLSPGREDDGAAGPHRARRCACSITSDSTR